MIKSKFKLGDQDIPMFLGFHLISEVFPEKGLDLFTIFEDTNNAVAIIHMNDKIMLQIWYYYVHEHNGMDYIKALHELDETKDGFEGFRRAFWDMVVAFFAQSGRGKALTALKEELDRQLRKVSNFTSSHSKDESQDLS